MDLRDYFAGKVLSGLVSVDGFIDSLVNDKSTIKAIARLSYEVADEMIKIKEEN